jgi:acetolactate synthase I/II/III large subunit
MEKIIPVEKGAEAFIELLNANKVDYIFLNPGTDTFPVHEVILRFKAAGKRTPEIILCLDESMALAAAHGYFMITGRPQVVLVHADLGPQQIGGALHNAQRGRIGVVICSGRVPSNFEKDRTNQVHWYQEQFDPHGVLRGYVKWEYELRSTENIHQVLQRAFQVAAAEPSGPVYLSLPQDILVGKMNGVMIPDTARFAPPAPPQADTALLEEAAKILAGAENPLLICGYSGRNPKSVASLVELAENLSARVVDSPTWMNFPNTHPLYCGFEPGPYFDKADAILIIDQDVPYIPSQTKPRAGTKIIHIDIDPLKENMPLWGFPVDILIQADSSKALPVLNRLVREKSAAGQSAKRQERLEQVRAEHQQMHEKWHLLAVNRSAQKPIAAEWLARCIDEAIDPETVVLGEPVSNRAALLHQLHRTQPGTYFQSGGSNLGWGLGAAIGAKLAAPDKTIVSVMGDGAFVFGCPVASLWASAFNKAPFLCVIFNNMRYNAPSLVLKQNLSKAGYVEKGHITGIDIKPCPDYAAIARACGTYGLTVEEPGELPSALKEGLAQVKGGKTAVLDVRISVA